MSKILIILALFLNLCSYAQTYKFYQTDNVHNQLRLNVKTGEVYQIQEDGQKYLVHAGQTTSDDSERYILHKTKNMWTYILLDRFTGKLWQCQYSVESIEHILSVPINETSLSNTPICKFSIQPLTSMYQYYLINEENGDMWKFQWSTEGNEYRWIEKM